MIIKKRIALLFIFLANMTLLAHAIIPHHNHDNQVCIEKKHDVCETSNHCSTKHEHDHDHEHDSEKESECCVLKQIVVIQQNQVNQAYKRFNLNTNHFSFNDYPLSIYINGFRKFVPISVTNEYTPLITSYHIHFVNTSLGLRAPPVV